MKNNNFIETFNPEDGYDFFLLHIFDYLPYIILNAIAAVSGILGNIIIIGSIWCSKKLHTMTNVIIVNLSFADLLISSITDTFAVAGVLHGMNFFNKYNWLCKFTATVCFSTCATGLLNMILLSFNRYIWVCYSHLYKKIFSLKKTIFYCFLTWLIAHLSDLPNYLGIGGHHFDKKTMTCIWNRSSNRIYTYTLAVNMILIPCIFVTFFYLKIFTITIKSFRQVKNRTKNNRKKKKINSSIKISLGLFASFILVIITVLPYGILIMIDFEDKLPRGYHLYTMLFARINSSLNPILYGVTNQSFRNGYKKFLRLIICQKIRNRAY